MKPIVQKLLSIGRGALKGAFPMIAGGIEAIKNSKGTKVEVTTESGEKVTGTAKLHSPWSYIPNILVGLAVIYAIHTKQIDPKVLVDLVLSLLSS